MSETNTTKDARAIFQNGGAAAVKAAVMDLEPITTPADFPKATPEPFPITRAGLSTGIAEARDFVESLLTEDGASVIYGPSNCGKSFWILDLTACVATGAYFRDELEVDRGSVVYVALEGAFGVRNRIGALNQAGRLPEDAPLFLCDAPVSPLELRHAARLAESVKNLSASRGQPARDTPAVQRVVAR